MNFLIFKDFYRFFMKFFYLKYLKVGLYVKASLPLHVSSSWSRIIKSWRHIYIYIYIYIYIERERERERERARERARER